MKPIGFALILLLAGLALYAQTFGFGFVFDDYLFIVNNPHIKNFETICGSWLIFPKTRLIGIYSFALNYHISQLNPLSYHIFNFIVHLSATALVWALSVLLFRIMGWNEGLRRQLPFFIALIFLVHPCQTQAVTYISQRYESMATVFYLGTVYCYLWARTESFGVRQIILFMMTDVLAVLGIMTKEVAVTIPLTLLALEWIVIRKTGYRQILIVAFAGLALGLLLMKMLHTDLHIFLQSVRSDSHDGDVLTGGNYFLTQMRVFLTFVRLMIFPVGQNVDYDYPMSIGLLHPPLTLLGMMVIAGIMVLIVQLRRNLPLISFGLAWILITFSINLAPRSNVIWEHKLYLISFGFILAVVTSLSLLIARKDLLVTVLIAMVAVLSFLTYERNGIWKDGITLWKDGIMKSPGKWRVYDNLTLAYSRSSRSQEGIDFYSRMIALAPENFRAYSSRSDLYYQLRQDDYALDDINKTIQTDPNNPELYIKRARVYRRQKHYEDALHDLERSVSLGPNVQVYFEKGSLEMSQGHTKQALDDFAQALKMDPRNYNVLENYTNVKEILRMQNLKK